ncbi:FecCD family ABC transporter permease [Roseobacter weihaiensis]|uniref:FecCD family ABC transporter permease n=1 Tax=Roseobacter weihaiensis TaxID=2763262 RepID=UPI001D0A440E|nr:iron ABC transporter permease [Roseobacter sp. H9]
MVVDRRQRARQLHGILALVLVAVSITSLAVGASGTSLWRALWSLAMGAGTTTTEAVILWEIRAPRTLLGACVGAALAVSGAVMQGLFRNPLADPGLLGVSAGAGLGALLAIVVGGALPFGMAGVFGDALLPVMAFVGAWASMMVLYAVATRSGRTSVATMLLAGIALGALTGAISGLLIFHADDLQLRELTFWQLGSLAGSSWAKVLIAGPVVLLATLIATTLARGLNGLALGEASAHHIGINVQRTKNIAILAVSAATGAAVAVSGGIGFVGIVVPHLLRLATGPDHHGLLVNSALLGASLLLMADIISRFVVAPAELPIGIVTAVLGAPFFLWILLRRRSVVDL